MYKLRIKMNIKSNDFKEIPFPSDFNDDDKEEYMKLLNLAKLEHSDVFESERWIIHYSIIMYIRKEKGLEQSYSEEELKEIISKYEIKVKEVTCKGDENPYLYDKENNPIFKDNSYFYKLDEEGKIAETKAEDKVIIEVKN